MDFITITIDRKVLKEIESIVEETSWGAPTGPGPGEEPPEYTRAGVRSVLDALRRAMKEANANAAHAAMVRKEARFDFGDEPLIEQKGAEPAGPPARVEVSYVYRGTRHKEDLTDTWDKTHELDALARVHGGKCVDGYVSQGRSINTFSFAHAEQARAFIANLPRWARGKIA